MLAELAEGVLDDATAREVQAHVDGCATCQATLDELAQVTVALQALPAELPVPEFVAARISHALAAERASGSGAAPSRPGADSGNGTVAWFRRRLPQGLAAAASVAVLGLAGYIAVDGSGGSDAGTSSAEDAAAAGAPEQPLSSSLDGNDSTGSNRAGTAGSTATADDDTPSVQDEELTTPNHIPVAELTAAVEQIVQNPTATPAFCGEALADELGLPRVGTANVGAGVLVVLDNATAYDGWLLETCNSRSNETLEPHVSVPKAE
ncbi:hypothetical protein C1I92_11315 [Jiangella anatolica]|uniref:Putative zinc-finger domain-containing protein n=1 Tax=Jiangella anatolica TaxID=2670374 RepID=A0A2W2BEK6_9ACTN|nr:hypothetical protein C1I92_11315 [Jiangella anatolica]